MSTEIDKRIVEMQFNNKNFESNVKTSMSTLDKLKQNLTMSGATKGFDAIGAAAEGVKVKFSAMQVMAITALTNITNSAVNAGKKIVKSLTMDPITDGFREYELVLGAVQTTMAGTGKTMEEVEAQLKRLDKYADDTIYSTEDMVNNLPKFTNAGVDLEKATTAMIGIANATALAGGDAGKAAIAFYNLGQSIGNGYLTRMDFNSINNAGIATMEWKQQMVDAAIAQGSLTKAGENAYEAGGKTFTLQSLFIDGLQKQWATTDVLMSVFEDYGDVTTEIGKKAQASAQEIKSYTMMMDSLKATAGTGWKDTWQFMFGNLEEAKVLWTGLNNVISDMISKSAEARNTLLKGWQDDGGRQALIDSFKNAFVGLSSIITPIKEAFNDMFPAMTGKRLADITKSIRDFTAKLKISDDTADKIKRTFSGLFALVDIAKDFFGAVFKGVVDVAGSMGGLSGGLLDAAARFGDFLNGIRDVIKDSKLFEFAIGAMVVLLQDLLTFLESVGAGIKKAISKIGDHISGFGDIDVVPLTKFSGAIDVALHPFTAIGKVFKKAWEIIVGVLEWARPYILKASSAIGGGITKLFGSLVEAFKDGDLQKFMTLVNTGLLGGALSKIGGFFGGLKKVVSKSGEFRKGIKDIFDGLRGSLEAFQATLKAKVLVSLATAVGILAASLWVISGIPAEKMMPAIAGITMLMTELSAAMMIMGKSSSSFKGLAGGTQFVAFALAILILAKALKSLSELDSGQMQAGITGVTALIIELTLAATIMSKNSVKMVKGSVGMIAMATAILILAQAVKSLSNLSPEELVKGLGAVGILLAEVALFTNLVNPKKLVSTGIGMIAMGAALKIMASAVITLSAIDAKSLVKGLGSIGILLAEVALFTNLVNPKKLVSTGIGMIAMGAALKIMSGVVETLGAMDVKTLIKGLGSLGIVLLAIGGFTTIVNPKKLVSTGVGMIGIGTALTIIAKALSSFGKMSVKEIAKSMAVLAGSLLIITVALNSMKGAIGGAAAMLVFASALNLMVPALMIFGNMSISEIAKSLGMLVGVFGIFGASALILGPLIPVMLGLAGSVALLGVGVLALGVGMVALSAGLTAFAVGGPAFIVGLTVMISAVIMAIPTAMVALAEGIILMIQTLADGLGIIIGALVKLFKQIIEGLIVLVPDIINAVFIFLTAMADAIIEFIPKLVELGVALLLGLLGGIADNIGEVTKTTLKVVEELLKGLADGIPGVIKAAVTFVSEFIIAIGKEIPRLVDAAFKMVINLCNGLATAIRENSYEMGKAGTNLATAIIEGIVKGLVGGVAGVVAAIVKVAKALWQGFKDFLGIKSPSKKMETEGGQVIAGIKNGLSNGITAIKTKAKEIGTAIFNGVKGAVSKIGDIASNVCNTLKDGLANGAKKVGNAAKSLGGKIGDGIKGVLKINSPSKVMVDMAHYVGEGLIVGLKDVMKPVSNAAEDVGEASINAMNSSLSRVSDIIDSDMELNPTIRPVIDMTNVEKGLASTFNTSQQIDIGRSISNSTNMATANASTVNRRLSTKNDNGSNGMISDIKSVLKSAISKPASSFENIFNITGDNPQDIAEEVSRIIQRQVERRDASWA